MTVHPNRRTLIHAGLSALAGAPLLACASQSQQGTTPAGLPKAGHGPAARLLPDAGSVDKVALNSKLGLGGTQLGSIFEATSDEQAYEMLEAAWAAGFRYFDTSPWYGLGLSERRLGNFLDSKDPGEYVLSTKIGRILSPARDVGQVALWKNEARFKHIYDYTAEGTRRSIEHSLQRLGVPKIDLVLIHDLAPSNDDLTGGYEAQFEVALKGAMPELTRMREEGVIGGWGLGSTTWSPVCGRWNNPTLTSFCRQRVTH